MRYLLLMGLILFSVSGFGQVHRVGVQGGINLSNFTSDIEFGDKKFKAGLVSGFNYEYTFPGKLTLGADLLYSQQGYKDEIAVLTVQDISWISGIKLAYDYISLPLKVGYTWGEQVKGFVKTGLCPSVLIRGEYWYLDKNFPGSPKEGYAYERAPKFDLGALVELGAAYAIKNDMELFSSLTYRKSFTTISSENHFQGLDMKHYLFSLSFGLKYKLGAN